MKVNSLLSDLYRGEWFMDVHSISAYAPLIKRLISAEDVTIQKSEQARVLNILDKNGRMVQKDDQGRMEIPKDSTAHIYMVGPVLKYGDWCTYGADDIVSALRFANNQENVKMIVLHMDGPGGAVSAIGPFLQFAKEKKKPVAVYGDAMMSLHYFAAVSVADFIVADNDVSARFGSVGIVSTFIDSRPVMEEMGYKFHEIYPEESKHKNEAFTLALEGKYDMIKEEQLSPIARKFQGAVRAARPGLVEATGVLTGKTFSADQSLEYGMIDGIGSLDSVLERLEMLVEIKKYKN